MKLKLRNQLFNSNWAFNQSYLYTVENENGKNKNVTLLARGKIWTDIGFGPIETLLKLYGFNLNFEAKRSSNLFIVFLGLLMTFIVLVETLIEFYLLINILNQVPVEITCISLTSAIFRLAIATQYIFICFTFNKTQKQLQSLVKILRFYIDDETVLAKIKSKSKKFVTLVIISTLILMVVVVSYTDNLIPDETLLIAIPWKVLKLFWVVLVLSCCITFTFLLGFLSQTVNEFTDWFMPEESFEKNENSDNNTTLRDHQLRHQTIADLLEHLSIIYSTFLMLSLIFELATVILFTRGATAYTYNGYVHFISMSVIQMIFFVTKNHYSSFLNDKVKRLLTFNSKLSSVNDLNTCQPEHIFYIIYICLKNYSNHWELSYGNFFPVRKAFIFSVQTIDIYYQRWTFSI
ncbi:hypothetical protein CHUAL_014214 [Chamberlinius hualienensis]